MERDKKMESAESQHKRTMKAQKMGTKKWEPGDATPSKVT